MSSCQLMFLGVRSSLESGFGLKPPTSSYRSYFYSSFKNFSFYTAPLIKHHKDEKFLYCEGHSERFTALRGEEKREEGVRGDPNEMRWNQ